MLYNKEELLGRSQWRLLPQRSAWLHAGTDGKVLRRTKALQEVDDCCTERKANLDEVGCFGADTRKLIEEEYEIAKYHSFQLVRKIQLNSAYGAMGNPNVRYFNTDIAEAITTSGRICRFNIANKLNEFLNKTLNTGDYDYVVASDTDSVYLRLERFGMLLKENQELSRTISLTSPVRKSSSRSSTGATTNSPKDECLLQQDGDGKRSHCRCWSLDSKNDTCSTCITRGRAIR